MRAPDAPHWAHRFTIRPTLTDARGAAHRRESTAHPHVSRETPPHPFPIGGLERTPPLVRACTRIHRSRRIQQHMRGSGPVEMSIPAAENTAAHVARWSSAPRRPGRALSRTPARMFHVEHGHCVTIREDFAAPERHPRCVGRHACESESGSSRLRAGFREAHSSRTWSISWGGATKHAAPRTRGRRHASRSRLDGPHSTQVRVSDPGREGVPREVSHHSMDRSASDPERPTRRRPARRGDAVFHVKHAFDEPRACLVARAATITFARAYLVRRGGDDAGTRRARMRVTRQRQAEKRRGASSSDDHAASGPMPPEAAGSAPARCGGAVRSARATCAAEDHRETCPQARVRTLSGSWSSAGRTHEHRGQVVRSKPSRARWLGSRRTVPTGPFVPP